MSGASRDWLPASATAGPRARAIVGEAVDRWSDKWFAGARVSLAALGAQEAGSEPSDECWRVHGGAVAIPPPGPDAIRIAGLALGADLDSVILSEPDRDILGRLAETIADDFGAALCALLGRKASVPETSAAWAGLIGPACLGLRLADASGRTLLRAGLSASALVPLVKAAIPAGAGPRMSAIGEAIGDSAARLDFRLGRTRLSLAELSGLAPGDVLVLDRRIDSGAEACVGGGRAFAGAALEPGKAATRLILSHQIQE